MDVGGQPAADVYIFTGKHYSMMFAATDRPQIDDTSKATADELRAMLGPMAASGFRRHSAVLKSSSSPSVRANHRELRVALTVKTSQRDRTACLRASFVDTCRCGPTLFCLNDYP